MEGEQKKREDNSAVGCNTGSSSEGLPAYSPDVANLENISIPVDTSASVSISSSQSADIEEAESPENVAACNQPKVPQSTNNELSKSNKTKAACDDLTNENRPQDISLQSAPSNSPNKVRSASKYPVVPLDSSMKNYFIWAKDNRENIPNSDDFLIPDIKSEFVLPGLNRNRASSTNGNQTQNIPRQDAPNSVASKDECNKLPMKLVAEFFNASVRDLCASTEVDSHTNIPNCSKVLAPEITNELPGFGGHRTAREDSTMEYQSKVSSLQNTQSNVADSTDKMGSTASYCDKTLESSTKDRCLWSGSSSIENISSSQEFEVLELSNDYLLEELAKIKTRREDSTNGNRTEDTMMHDAPSSPVNRTFRLRPTASASSANPVNHKNSATCDEFQVPELSNDFLLEGLNLVRVKRQGPTNGNQTQDACVDGAPSNVEKRTFRLRPSADTSVYLGNPKNVASCDEFQVPELNNDYLLEGLDQIRTRCEDFTNRNQTQDTFTQDAPANAGEASAKVDNHESLASSSRESQVSSLTSDEFQSSDFEKIKVECNVTTNGNGNEAEDAFTKALMVNFEGNVASVASAAEIIVRVIESSMPRYASMEPEGHRENATGYEEPGERNESNRDTRRNNHEGGTAESDELDKNIQKYFELSMHDLESPRRANGHDNNASREKPEEPKEPNREANSDQPEENFLDSVAFNDYTNSFFNFTIQNLLFAGGRHDHDDAESHVEPEQKKEAVKSSANKDHPGEGSAEMATDIRVDRVYDLTTQIPQLSGKMDDRDNAGTSENPKKERVMKRDATDDQSKGGLAQVDIDSNFDLIMKDLELPDLTDDHNSAATSVKPKKQRKIKYPADEDHAERGFVKIEALDEGNIDRYFDRVTQEQTQKSVDDSDNAKCSKVSEVEAKMTNTGKGGAAEGGQVKAAVSFKNACRASTSAMVEQGATSKSNRCANAAASVNMSELLLPSKNFKPKTRYSDEPADHVEIQFLGNSKSRLTGRSAKSVRNAESKNRPPSRWRTVTSSLCHSLRISRKKFSKFCTVTTVRGRVFGSTPTRRILRRRTQVPRLLDVVVSLPLAEVASRWRPRQRSDFATR